MLSHLSLPGDFGKHQGGEGKGCTASRDQTQGRTLRNDLETATEETEVQVCLHTGHPQPGWAGISQPQCVSGRGHMGG